MKSPLTLGARDEGLARAQAEYVLAGLKEQRSRFPVHLELIGPEPGASVTVHDDHIAENRKGIATLHRLLRKGEVDLIIHRAFDLRDRLPDDLQIAAIPQRCSPFDALLSIQGLTLDELEAGTPVGVVQRRSRVQIHGYRDDLDLTIMPGDVGSWLVQLLDQKIEGLILPNAAVEHLGLQERVCEIFPADLIIPAPGSGILVCVCRKDDEATQRRLKPIHDEGTAAEYETELAFMRAVGESWDEPVAALAQCMGRRMLLLGMVADDDGRVLHREGVDGLTDEPGALGEALAELLRRSRRAGGARVETEEIDPIQNILLGLGAPLGLDEEGFGETESLDALASNVREPLPSDEEDAELDDESHEEWEEEEDDDLH